MIFVAPLHNPVSGAVNYTVERLHEVFDTPVAIHTSRFDPSVAFEETRQQYNSTILLTELLKDLPSQDARVIGITDVDLFIPVLTFVFGEAQLNGHVGLASSFRLRNSYYGLPENAELVLERLGKEAVHEMGHVFGLTHCNNYTCAMHASTGVEEIDLKKVTFCRPCRDVLWPERR
jgi:archaemetzincin